MTKVQAAGMIALAIRSSADAWREVAIRTETASIHTV